MNAITTDPKVTEVTNAYRSDLDAAMKANADAQSKLSESKSKLDALKARLSQGDTTVTVPALQSSAVAVERCELVAAGTQRRLDVLKRSPKLPAVGVAQVVAEALAELYPVPVTITTDRSHEPEELPHLVIVLPQQPAEPKGGSVVSLRELELVLHRRSVLERHHEAAKIKAALEAIGWQVRADEPDEGETGQASFLRIYVTAGYEAVPAVLDDSPTNGFEVRDALALAFGHQFLNFDSVSYDVTPPEVRHDGDVATTKLGLRVSSWEVGHMKGQLPSLTGTGDPRDRQLLATIATRLKGITQWGRIVGVEPVDGTPGWSAALPELKARRVGGSGWNPEHGGKAIRPTAAAFVTLELVSKAQPNDHGVELDGDVVGERFAPGTEPDGYHEDDSPSAENEAEYTEAQRFAAFTASER